MAIREGPELQERAGLLLLGSIRLIGQCACEPPQRKPVDRESLRLERDDLPADERLAGHRVSGNEISNRHRIASRSLGCIDSGEAVGMTLVPLPGGPDNLADVTQARGPAQFLDDLVRTGDQHGGIAGPSADNLVGNRLTDDFLACSQHFEHGRAGSGTEVVSPTHSRLERKDGALVCLGQVRCVDVIAHTAPVAGRVVAAVYQYLGPPADSHVKDEWNQVGLVTAVFAEIAVRVGARGVKVPQQRVT